MENDIKEILNKIGYHQHIHEHLTLNPKELDILAQYIIKTQEKLNLAENILYDYLYKDNKITKELYDKFKGSDE